MTSLQLAAKRSAEIARQRTASEWIRRPSGRDRTVKVVFKVDIKGPIYNELDIHNGDGYIRTVESIKGEISKVKTRLIFSECHSSAYAGGKTVKDFRWWSFLIQKRSYVSLTAFSRSRGYVFVH